MADPKLKTVSEQLLETLRAAHERSREGYNITYELARAVTEAEALLAVPELGTCDGNHGGPRCADPECWNDSAPASDPLKDHQIAAVVNKVCRLAREFHNHDSLRQRIAQELVPALKQQATPEPVGEPDTVPLDALHAAERERDYWKTRARAMLDHAEGTCWYWMGGGEDHLESLVNSLPVVIRADQLRELLARPAPGVPEGLPAVLTDWGFDVHDDEEGRTWLTIRNPDDDVARMSVPTVWPLTGYQTIGAVVLHQFSAALTSALAAAAQAKGGQA